MKLLELIRTATESKSRVEDILAFHEEILSCRALEAGTAPAGGFTIGDPAGQIAAALRSHSVVAAAGATFQTVNQAGGTLPKITQGATAGWYSETGTVQESSVVFGTLNPSARRLSALVRISNQLISQTGGLAEAALARDVRAAVGRALDLGVLVGIGGAEPIGVFLSDAIPAPTTFSGAPTRSKLAEIEAAVGDAGGEQLGGMSWITSTTARKKLRTTLNDSVAGAGYLWADDNTILGAPAYATPLVVSDQIAFGNWRDLAVILFGVAQVIVDPFARKKSAETEILITLMADAGPLRSGSFARSVDSAAQ